MSVTKKDFQIMQKVGEDDYLLIHPETNAGNVEVELEGIAATNAAGALVELKNAIESKAALTDIPDVSEFITKAVTDLVNYYNKAVIDGKIEDLEGKISAVPKFGVRVVSALPESDISDTTLYLVKTGDDSGNLYTEYIYIDSAWEELGTQSLNLAGYATETWVEGRLAECIGEAEVNALISAALAGYAKTSDIASATVAKAGTADKLTSAKTITASGDVAGSVSFDGSKNETMALALSNTGVAAGTYSAVAVDSKGRVTGGSQAIEIGTNGQTTPSANLAIGGLFFKRI